jgi:hypothetical protein
MIGRSISAILATLFVLAAAGSASAAGGVYLDDLTLTNYGTSMFTDGFNDKSLRGWTNLKDVSLGQLGQGSLLMHMNAHGSLPATAWRALNVKDAGVVEVSTKLMVMPPDEQSRYKNNSYSLMDLTVCSGSSPAMIKAVVNLRPKEKANRVSIGVQQTVDNPPPAPAPKTKDSPPVRPTLGPQNSKTKNSGATSPTALIQPKTWVLLTLKLDSKTSTASVLVDNKQIVSKPYKPKDFESVRGIWLQCSYGDGVAPDKGNG